MAKDGKKRFSAEDVTIEGKKQVPLSVILPSLAAS